MSNEGEEIYTMLGFPDDGINYSSPVVQGMVGTSYSMPPNPIGNVRTIGGYGYNGNNVPFNQFMNSPYYNNSYGYVNPYTLIQQQKAMEAARKEAERNQIDTMKHISRIVHKSLKDIEGEELETFLDNTYNYEEASKEFEELYQQYMSYIKLSNLKPVQPNYAYVNYANAVSAKNKARFPDDMSLADYLDKAGELYMEAIIAQNERRERNGKLKYDSNKYRSIIDLHRSTSSYFNSLLTGKTKSVDIGDLEIQIPPNGEKPKMVVNMPSKYNEYKDRRARFINACMNTSRRDGL